MHLLHNHHRTDDARVCFRGAAIVCLIAASQLLPACTQPQQASNFHLATVSASPEHGLLFVAQPGRGAVDVLGLAPVGRRNEAPRFVAQLIDAERNHVLRLTVDRERARLWIVDFRIVQVYGLPGLELLRSYRLETSAYHERFSDLALDGAGNALLLSRGGAHLHRIDGGTLELAHWLDLDRRASDAALLLANRALMSADDRYLLLTAPLSGELLRIDLRTKAVVPVASAANLNCSLLFWEVGSSAMRVLDCLGRWQARLELAADNRAASLTMQGGRPVAGSVTAFPD